LETLPPEALKSWQRRILITSWLTYAGFYLGRVNLAVALPALQNHFGWSRSEAGLIGSAFFWLYAIGQLVNGALGDRWNPRRFVAAGLVASALMNLAFGFSSALPLFILVWGVNGYVQSTGWGPIMRTLSNWFDSRERGRVTAIFGPCYAAGHVASWLLAGFLAARVGWRAAFVVPAGLLLITALFWWRRVRSSPQEVRASQAKKSAQADLPIERAGGSPWSLFQQPQMRLAALACIALGVVKESFNLWTPTFLMESSSFNLAQAAGYAIWLPLAGAAGIVLAGWVSHRFFRSEEAPVTAALMGGLALAALLFRPLIASVGVIGIPLALGLVGMMTNGANGLLLTALPMTQSVTQNGQNRVSSAAGLLDFASYVGAGLGGMVSGLLADSLGWGAAFIFWAIAALAGMVAMIAIWHGSDEPITNRS
jgi:sugar phosphate permease